MYLSSADIKNFRGIRSARIEFGETTVLIGENDSGKTTVLEAISKILAPDSNHQGILFQFHDFFMIFENGKHRPVGPLNIRLTFRERKPDEWSFIRQNDFGLTLEDVKDELQELTLEVRADPALEGKTAEASWRIHQEKKQPEGYSKEQAILDWFRRLNPVFRIKSGLLTEMQEEDEHKDSPVDTPRAEHYDIDRNLVDKIRQAYLNLVSGNTTDRNMELQTGYRAALQYLGKVSNAFLQEGMPLEQIIYEILGKKHQDQSSLVKKVSLRRGSAAEKIGMLIFTTAFLQSGGLMADPSAEPIIIIEDPEAHLHPMTLESVKLMIERLNWQKIITTQSGSLLADFQLEDIRRITRKDGYIRQYWARPGSLSREELRRLSYHVRKRLNNATFARCWLLVEGESEIWLMPHIARLCGYDLMLEGVVCVEFAQCGIAPLIKAARQLGINWFLMADGDAAGKSYIESARHFAMKAGENPEDHFLRLRERDIENHFYFNGYASVYQEYSGIPPFASQNMQPGRIINRAIHRNSKPFMAIAIVDAIAQAGSPGVPGPLRQVVETCVKLASETS